MRRPLRAGLSAGLLLCLAGLYGCAQHDILDPGWVRVSSGVMSGQLVKRVSPQHICDYGPGAVASMVRIDVTGKVVEVTKVLGPEKKFEAYADAIRQREYRPYLVDGVATPVNTTIMEAVSCGAPDPDRQ